MGDDIRVMYQGDLLKKEYSTGEYWENIHGIVLKNGIQYSIDIPEGRAVWNDTTWKYEFDYKDHLGNTRVSFKADGDSVLQTAKSDFDPWGVILKSSASNSVGNRFEMQGKERELTFGLNRVNFGARNYNPTNGRWDRVDDLSEKYNSHSPYNYVSNNPINRIDPDGNSDFGVNDFVRNSAGNIYWDKDANSQASAKAGETYLGSTLNFTFNSYIDAKLWDGPTMGGLVDPSGDKLTSTIRITGNKNSDGELTSISASRSIKVGETPMGKARDCFPGLGDSQNKFTFSQTNNSNGTLGTYKLNFEQHASVSPSEGFGLNMMGYDIVNVAQKATFSLTGNQLSVKGYTDVFPSATLSGNGLQLFKYNQPSFIKTHSAGSRPKPSFYKR